MFAKQMKKEVSVNYKENKRLPTVCAGPREGFAIGVDTVQRME